MECSFEGDEPSPNIHSFLTDLMSMQDIAVKRLQDLRRAASLSKNRRRQEATYSIGGYVLVHKDRWRHKKTEEV